MNTGRRRRATAVAVAATFVVAFAYWVLAGGVRFEIVNAGDSQMDSVVVHATGRAYSLGTVAPGASAKRLVRADGDSHFEIEFGPSFARTRHNLGGYFGPRYTGTLVARRTADTVFVVEDSVRLPRFW